MAMMNITIRNGVLTMDFVALRSFVEVCRSGGFTRAADHLHLSQPAVSGHIKRLEEELGILLLQRSPHGLTITPEGEAVLPAIRRMLALEQQIKQISADLRWVEQGEVRLACGVTHAATRLPQALRAYAEKRSGVTVKLQVAASKQAQDLLLWSEVDVALVTTPGHNPSINQKPLFKDPFLAVGPPEAKGYGLAEALSRFGLVTFPTGRGLRRYVDSALEQRGLNAALRRITEIESLEAARSLVQAGMGVTFLPEVAVAELVADGRLLTLPVPGPPLERITYVCTGSGEYITHAARDFVEFITQFFEPAGTDTEREGE